MLSYLVWESCAFLQELLCALGPCKERFEAEIASCLCPELAFCIEAKRRGREHICLGCQGRMLVERDMDGLERKMPGLCVPLIEPAVDL